MRPPFKDEDDDDEVDDEVDDTTGVDDDNAVADVGIVSFLWINQKQGAMFFKEERHPLPTPTPLYYSARGANRQSPMMSATHTVNLRVFYHSHEQLCFQQKIYVHFLMP